MKPTLYTIAAVIAAAGTIHAQPGEGRPPGPPPPVISVLDSDKDGKISAEEIAASPEALATLDENEDGELTRDELRPKPPEGAADAPEGDEEAQEDRPMRRGKRRMGPPPVVAVLDADRDGKISAEEIENAPEALAKLDKNEDGELTRDELRPPRRGGRPPMGKDEEAAEGERPQGPGGQGRPERRGPRGQGGR